MTLARRSGLFYLLGTASLLRPTSALAGAGMSPYGWVAIEDGAVQMRSVDPGVTPSVYIVGPDVFPASLEGRALPDQLHAFRADTPGTTGFESGDTSAWSSSVP